jgi:uncharacterized MAPEG superfamily protein
VIHQRTTARLGFPAAHPLHEFARRDKRLQLENYAAIDHAETMTVEIQMLALSTVLGLGQIVLSAHARSLRYGYRWAASARDEAMTPLTGVPARLERALRNFLESFPLFTAAILIANIIHCHSWMTIWGAQLYFWGRLVYVPLYAMGATLVRSVAWNVATIGIIFVLLALL